MRIGVSTGCLYPALTEVSFEKLLRGGFDLFEIFFNTFSELDTDYLDRIKYRCSCYGAEIRSVHPFTSSFESYLLFSGYERRFIDGVKMYDMYFRAAQRLGAEFVVIHGMQIQYSSISDNEYFRRFNILSQEGKKYGITLLQENVYNHHSGSIDFIRRMKDYSGKDAAFVLDAKQARRCGYDPGEMAEVMGDALRHIHISDGYKDEQCTLPGTGDFDFYSFFDTLGSIGYKGDMVIEVYGNRLYDIPSLIEAKKYLEIMVQSKEA